MPETTWNHEVETLRGLLDRLEVTDARGGGVTPDEGFCKWRALASEVRRGRRAVYLIGNGASASMASHLAADLAKNAGIHAEVFSDLSLITAISNDLGYDQVFAVPLGRRCKEGDLLVAISSSGGSPNILAAVELARQRQLGVITLSAMEPENPLRWQGELNFYVPAQTYGRAESCHAAILHYWMDGMERVAGQGEE